MSLQQLQQILRSQGSTISISESIITQAGLAPRQNTDEIIASYLQLDSTLSAINVHSIPDPVGNTLTINTGMVKLFSKTNFIDLLVPSSFGEISIVFSIDSNNITDVNIIITLPASWKLSNSFKYIDSTVDSLLFSQAYLVFTTNSTYTLDYVNPLGVHTNVTIITGLNYVANLKLDDKLKVIVNCLSDYDHKDLVISGSIDTAGLQDKTFTDRAPYPMIDLTAPINAQVNLPNFKGLAPEIKVLSESFIPDGNIYRNYYMFVYFNITLQVQNQAQILAPKAQNPTFYFRAVVYDFPILNFSLVPDPSQVVTIDDLISLIGGVDFTKSIPKELQDFFSDISFDGFSVSMSIGEAISVTSLSLAIGAAKAWQINDECKIDKIQLTFSVFNPFTSSAVESFSFKAELELWYPRIFDGVFDIVIDVDSVGDLLVSGEYVGNLEIQALVNEISSSITLPSELQSINFQEFLVTFDKVGSSYTYTLYCSSQGSISIPLIEDKDFDTGFTLLLSRASQSKETQNLVKVIGSVNLGDVLFSIEFDMSSSTGSAPTSNSDMILSLVPYASNVSLDVGSFLGNLGMDEGLLPPVIKINLPTVILTYYFTNVNVGENLDEFLEFEVDFAGTGKFTISMYKDSSTSPATNQYLFNANLLGLCQQLPLVGKLFAQANSTQIGNIALDYASEDITLGTTKYQKGFSITGINQTSSHLSGIVSNNLGTDPTNVSGIWIPIQKTLGPITIEKIGLNYDSGSLDIMLNAALAAGPLSFELLGLGIGIPISSSSFSVFLSGLGLSYIAGDLMIEGAFLKVNNPDYKLQFDGELSVVAGAFGLSAIGSYVQEKDDTTSMFAYVVIDYPLGGIPAFFITGGAAGFGYNRDLILPDITQVANFPLVKIAQNPLNYNTSGMADILQNLSGVIPIKNGEYFATIGITFTSYELVNSIALVTVSFGVDLEISLLGLSTITMPPDDNNNPIAMAQLALEAKLLPSQGIFSIIAQLTPNSYVLSTDCHLTGGFAFYLWFTPTSSDAINRSGDFVVTLGGYHPLFKKPDWYPDVPRLGLNWNTGDLSFKGGLYFAVTPVCIMAGGEINATWSSGCISAWFDLYADILIYWKPYHYDIDAGVDIGVSVDISLLFCSITITVHIGANIHMWGPDFAGVAHISLYIATFTINFGSSSAQGIAPIPWNEFAVTFLDSGYQQNSSGPSKSTKIANISIGAGLISTPPASTNYDWIVDPESLRISSASLIPINDLKINNAITDLTNFNTGFGVGLVMVETTSFSSSHLITINYEDKLLADLSYLNIVPTTHSASKSVWSCIPAPNGDLTQLQQESLSGDNVLDNVVFGIDITTILKTGSQTPAIPINNLLWAVACTFSVIVFNKSNVVFHDTYGGLDPLLEIKNTISANSARDSLISSFVKSSNPNLRQVLDLRNIEEFANINYFSQNPTLSHLGEEKLLTAN